MAKYTSWPPMSTVRRSITSELLESVLAEAGQLAFFSGHAPVCVCATVTVPRMSLGTPAEHCAQQPDDTHINSLGAADCREFVLPQSPQQRCLADSLWANQHQCAVAAANAAPQLPQVGQDAVRVASQLSRHSARSQSVSWQLVRDVF